jgi:hypothetical protein
MRCMTANDDHVQWRREIRFIMCPCVTTFLLNNPLCVSPVLVSGPKLQSKRTQIEVALLFGVLEARHRAAKWISIHIFEQLSRLGRELERFPLNRITFAWQGPQRPKS